MKQSRHCPRCTGFVMLVTDEYDPTALIGTCICCARSWVFINGVVAPAATSAPPGVEPRYPRHGAHYRTGVS